MTKSLEAHTAATSKTDETITMTIQIRLPKKPDAPLWKGLNIKRQDFHEVLKKAQNPFELSLLEIFDPDAIKARGGDTKSESEKALYLEGYLRCVALMDLLIGQAKHDGYEIADERIEALNAVADIALAYKTGGTEVFADDSYEDQFNECYEDRMPYLHQYADWINGSNLTIRTLEQTRHPFTIEKNACDYIAFSIREMLLHKEKPMDSLNELEFDPETTLVH